MFQSGQVSERMEYSRAPVSSQNVQGIKRALIRPGVSEVTLCHDNKGTVGLKFRDLNKVQTARGLNRIRTSLEDTTD